MNYKLITILVLVGINGISKAANQSGRARTSSQPINIRSLGSPELGLDLEVDGDFLVEPGAPRVQSRLASRASAGVSDISGSPAPVELDSVDLGVFDDVKTVTAGQIYLESSPEGSRSSTVTSRPLTSPWAFASVSTSIKSPSPAPVRLITSPVSPVAVAARIPSVPSRRSLSPDSRARLEVAKNTLKKINLEPVDVSEYGTPGEVKPAANEVLKKLREKLDMVLAGGLDEQQLGQAFNHPRIDGLLCAAGRGDGIEAQDLLLNYVRGVRGEVVSQKPILNLPGRQTTVRDLCMGAYGQDIMKLRAQISCYLDIKDEHGEPRVLGSGELLAAAQIEKLVINRDTGLNQFQIRGVDFDQEKLVGKAKSAPILIPVRSARK